MDLFISYEDDDFNKLKLDTSLDEEDPNSLSWGKVKKSGRKGSNLSDDVYKPDRKYNSKERTKEEKWNDKYGIDQKKLTGRVKNKVGEINKKEDKSRKRRKDKNDRATVDNVLDPRTLIILHKWVKNGSLSEVNGCISTGKEASVYHGSRKDLNQAPEEEGEEPYQL